MRQPENLTEAEERLRAAVRDGEAVDYTVGDPERDDPSEGVSWGPERTLRAAVVRALCIGVWPDVRIDPRGIQIVGARVVDPLDLEAVILAFPLRLRGCHLEGELRLVGATVKLLDLGGTYAAASILADSFQVSGSLRLNNGFVARGEVRLPNAKIGGQLSCTGGTFENPGGYALSADGADIGGSVFLRQGFIAKGEVRLTGIKIGGQLSCVDGTFENPGGYALSAGGTQVNGALLWRSVTVRGTVNLHHTRVGQLADDAASWPARGALVLDGFEYEALAGGAPITARERLDWLARQHEFRPQPYEHLVRVLRHMGHEDDAREVAIAKQEALRQSGRLPPGARIWNRFLGLTVAHGYKPGRALWLALAVIAFGSGWFFTADWAAAS